MRMAKLTSWSFSYYCRAELCDEGYTLPVALLGSAWEEGDRGLRVEDAGGILADLSLSATRTKALDIVVAVPKAVSVAYALADPPDREGITRAHELAVARVVHLMEQLDVSRRSRGGEAVGSTGLYALGVSHRLSRSQDPHLHTHVVVANRVQYHDRLGALDYGTLRRHLGGYELAYRNELRARLLDGTGRELIGTGLETWRIKGVNSQTTEVFSKRRAQVLEGARPYGESTRARQIATLQSRDPKRRAAQVDLDAKWAREARSVHDLTQELPTEKTVVGVSVSDPLLKEMCSRFMSEHLSIDEALASVIETAWRAKPELVPALDGSLLRGYSGLSLGDRLDVAGLCLPKEVRLAPISPQRSVGAVLAALESQDLGGSARLQARSAREQDLLRRSAQLSDKGRGPLAVVAAEALSPSELSRLVESPYSEAVLFVSDGSAARLRPREVVVVGNEGGRTLVVAESAKAVWDSYVARVAEGIANESTECYLSPSPRVLRSELAEGPLAGKVVGTTETGLWFLGERVRDESGTGWVVGAEHGEVRVRDDAGNLRSAIGRNLSSVSLARDLRDERGAVVVYGKPDGVSPERMQAAYLAVPGVDALASQLRSMTKSAESLSVSGRTVEGFSRARLAALSETRGRIVGDAAKTWELARQASHSLAKVYDQAHELGFDPRRGRSRMLDERAPMIRARDLTRTRDR